MLQDAMSKMPHFAFDLVDCFAALREQGDDGEEDKCNNPDCICKEEVQWYEQ